MIDGIWMIGAERALTRSRTKADFREKYRCRVMVVIKMTAKVICHLLVTAVEYDDDYDNDDNIMSCHVSLSPFVSITIDTTAILSKQ